MTITRTLTLAATAASALALALTVAPSRAQDMVNDAETQDMLFIQQCLQRAAAEKVPEDRIDDFIERCLNELYEQKERAGEDGDEPPHDGDGAGAPGGAD